MSRRQPFYYVVMRGGCAVICFSSEEPVSTATVRKIVRSATDEANRLWREYVQRMERWMAGNPEKLDEAQAAFELLFPEGGRVPKLFLRNVYSYLTQDVYGVPEKEEELIKASLENLGCRPIPINGKARRGHFKEITVRAGELVESWEGK